MVLFTIFSLVPTTGIVQESDSLFEHLYRSSMDYDWYRRMDYTPYFYPTFPPNNSVSESDVTALCAQLGSCRYDYMVAQSRDIASDTKHMVQWEEEVRVFSEKGELVL